MNNILDTVISQDNFTQITSIGWIIIAIIWGYTILWTARDIFARSDNGVFQFLCVLLVIVGSPLVGVPLYLLIRPISLKDDIIGRQTLIDMESVTCGSCMRPNLTGYDHCVFCGSTLKIHCKNCKEMYPHTHRYCFKCGAPNLTWKE